MRILPGVLLVLSTAASAAAEEAFVEIAAPKAEVYAGEPVPLTLRVGIERRFLAGGLVPSTLRPLDVPVRIDLPWIETHAGTAPLPDAPADPATPRATMALNDAVVAAARLPDLDRGGRPFALFEWTRTFVPLEPGALEIPAPVLRYATASKFSTDAFGARVPLDRRDEEARGGPLRIRVLPLPPGGPGPVGSYSIDATLAPAEGGVRLTLRIEGTGNLPLLESAGPEAVEGFHLLGKLDDRAAPRRTLTYDLRPLPGTVAVPALLFAFFDPGPPASWGAARTQPLPLSPELLTPGPGGNRDSPAKRREPPVATLVIVVVVAILAAVVARRRRANSINN